MKKKRLVLTVLTLLAGLFALDIQLTKAYGTTIHISADGNIDPPDAPIASVDNVTYTFADNIHDSIVVERDNIVVDGKGYTINGADASEFKGICLTGRNNVTIKNALIKAFYYGVSLNCCSNINISGNSITDHVYGIYLYESSDNTVYGNNIANNWFGTRLRWASNNKLSRNNITDNRDGIGLTSSSNNIISGNNIINQTSRGIELWGSTGNIVSGNNITNNHVGTKLYWASGNHFFHNTFTGNFLQVIIERPGSRNSWDDGSFSGGNYWSDYGGVDADRDGIGDTPYVIDENNRDRYPFWGFPPSPFWAQWWFWTMVATGMIVLATFVHVLKRRARVGIVTLLWSVLIVLLFFYPSFTERLGQQVSFFLWAGYILATSLSLTKLFEKESIVERFGLKKKNALGLLVLICLGLGVVHYFDLNELLDSKALEAIIFAPLLEEIFYRGYMLGTLCKSNHDERRWRPEDLVWIVFAGLLFALGHIFSTYPRALMINIFAGSLSLGFLYVWSRTILWSYLAHMLYNLSIPFGFVHQYFCILTIFSVIILLMYFLENTGLAEVIRANYVYARRNTQSKQSSGAGISAVFHCGRQCYPSYFTVKHYIMAALG